MSAPAAVPRSPFGVRDFRLLWLGEAVSALGDQFALIALPWLALVLTGSALALGSVLALMAVPRALLMLIGGVSVDRLSPRRVMLGSNAVRLVAVTALGLVVLADAERLWMLYAFALVFGIADAFFFPAQTSIVPELVEPDQLQQANGITQGTTQATVLLGPAVAGVVIAALGSDGSQASSTGIATALLFDGASFLASLATLLLIRSRPAHRATTGSMVESIREGVRFLWRSPGLRAVVLISLTGNLLIVGPFEVGFPMIAYSRLPEGAAAFGLIMSAFGGGSLLGYVAGAILPAPRPGLFAAAVMGTLAIAGLGVAALAPVGSTVIAAALCVVAGIALGYGNLLGLSWAQARIPPKLMGRVMSILLLGSVGLVPISELIAGAAVQVSLEGMLVVAGVGMAAFSLGSLLWPTIRNLGYLPKYEAPTSESAGNAAASQAAGRLTTGPSTAPGGATQPSA
jgi:MFS family permease